MKRKAVRAVLLGGAVAAVLGLVPGDEATGHTCFKAETTSVTSTTLGDPSCRFHDPADHACAGSTQDPDFVVCVEVS